MTNNFDVSRFQTNDKHVGVYAPSVCIPVSSFRVNPDPSGMLKNALITRIDKKWYLVDDAVKQAATEAGLFVQRANLYEGVRANRQRFILPVTHNADPTLWLNSAKEMIREARQHWIRREADDDNPTHLIYRDDSVKHEPEWCDDFMALIQAAFGDRIVDANHPLINGKGKRNRKAEVVLEEFDE